MMFNSLHFLIFFPIVVLVYYIIPSKWNTARLVFLLIASYYFYMCWNPTYALLMAFSSFITYISGILIERSRKRHPDNPKVGRLWVTLSLTINLSILFFFKYFNFIVHDLLAGLGAVFPELSIGNVHLSILLPVGISFYTFQALSYTIDAYRGDVDIEHSVLRYFVFVSFFPQLVAGPIERSSNLLRQFYEKHTFDIVQVRDGLLLMLWGFFQKLVIADRLAILVNNVFNHYQHYNGVQLFIAAVFFAFEIYCDFGGYSNIAIGAAQVMGFSLMMNFNTPYFSKSIAEFWRRWHISLSTWFRDYLYFPLGGSRCSKKRRYFNLMVVFLTSGLWHGAGWNFIVWGGLNGLFQIIGLELKPIKEKLFGALHIDTSAFSHRIGKIIITFLLVDFTWIFFCASDIRAAFGIIGRMFSTFSFTSFFDGSLFSMRLSSTEFLIAIVALLILFAVDIMHYKGMKLRDSLAKQGLWFRYIVYLTGIFIVLIFGIYGPGFEASQFIYFQF